MQAVRHVLTILAVEDVSRSADFYRAAFGWDTCVEVPVYVEFLIEAERRLGVYQREAYAHNTGQVPHRLPPGTVSATELYFHCADPAAAAQHLERAGARCLSSLGPRPWGDEAVYFADPDGNVLVLARPLS